MRTKRRPQTARLTPKERLERVPHLRVEVQVLCGGEKRVNIARESVSYTHLTLPTIYSV